MRIPANDIAPDSGIPPPGRLGAAKWEFFAVLLAIMVLAVIVIGFWIEATP